MMKIVDPHFHLWDLNRFEYPWLTSLPSTGVYGDNSAIRRNYLISDFLGESQEFILEKAVHIEAAIAENKSLDETAWLQDIADEPTSSGVPNGIVVYCDLSDPKVSLMLDRHVARKNVRGVRQILNMSTDGRLSFTAIDYMNTENWNAGFAELKPRNLSFDLQIYPHQVFEAAALAARFPTTQIILNHTGMPIGFDRSSFASWANGMERLAKEPNAAVKISGLGMMFHTISESLFRPFVRSAIDFFGVDRCMFASNFPVDGMYSTYDTLWRTFTRVVDDFTVNQKEELFCKTAVKLYRL